MKCIAPYRLGLRTKNTDTAVMTFGNMEATTQIVRHHDATAQAAVAGITIKKTSNLATQMEKRYNEKPNQTICRPQPGELQRRMSSWVQNMGLLILTQSLAQSWKRVTVYVAAPIALSQGHVVAGKLEAGWRHRQWVVYCTSQRYWHWAAK